MRLVWDATVLQNSKMKSPLAMALALIFLLCSLKLGEKEQNHCEHIRTTNLQLLTST
jgi:hypothetical protein